jgi:hypothetical protein
MPLNLLGKRRRLLHQLLRVVLAEMLLLKLLVQSQDIRSWLELGDGY